MSWLPEGYWNTGSLLGNRLRIVVAAEDQFKKALGPDHWSADLTIYIENGEERPWPTHMLTIEIPRLDRSYYRKYRRF